METILDGSITVSLVVGVMAKVTMVMLLVMSLVMLRQAVLMDKVIKLPVRGSIKTLIWSYFALILLLTVIVVLA